mmetsp:Transcript_13183/g.17084  ORF Transcript_13183/g.17084 Transcript_13183/m.17084 type:complete len:200 (+) Transcript_13183:25-624(+)
MNGLMKSHNTTNLLKRVYVRSYSQFRVCHYDKVSKDYLKDYFDQYVLAYNRASSSLRDDQYAANTAEIMSQFDNIHAYVAENNGKILAGTLLIEIRTDSDLDNLKKIVGERVNNIIKQEVLKEKKWYENGLYFHKGSFKHIEDPVNELYYKTFLGVKGLHAYSTLPKIRDSSVIMKSHVPIADDIIMDKLYSYYMFEVK